MLAPPENELTSHVLAAAFGVLSQAMLAILLLQVWRVLRERWAVLMGIGFAINALYDTRVMAGVYVDALGAVPQAGNAALVLTSLVVCTAAFLEYSGIDARVARRLLALAGATAIATFIGVADGLVTRRAGLAVWAGFMLAWAVLFACAIRREPGHGHAFNTVASLSYPALVLAVLHGDLDSELLVAAHAGLMAVFGMTLLTTGLLRGQWRANRLLGECRHVEGELRRVNETLEQRVALRTTELRDTIEGLKSFNRSISHDLSGPLGGIVGVAQLARDHVVTGDAAAAERMLHAIAAQAETSRRLVGALLSLAQSSDATLQREAVDAEALALEVIESLRQTRALDMFLIVVAGLPQVHADAGLLRQVFINLIGNALKFAAGARHPRIDIGATEREGATIFHVRDNGVGFDAAEGQLLFKPFKRLHGQRFEGFGVGLSIVKRIVDRHGGDVWSEASPGGGATFFFTLTSGAPDGLRDAHLHSGMPGHVSVAAPEWPRLAVDGNAAQSRSRTNGALFRR
jgi:signal transduction histidine kinase